ncbi:MAG TPA: hypothetical protein VFJ16_23930 [Longimicrobium sp.]|nr:hypothetical protein [Longimicrobium sp.]
MKKVKLNPDELSVESFSATAETAFEGTVMGHASEDTNCNTFCLGTCRPIQCKTAAVATCPP